MLWADIKSTRFRVICGVCHILKMSQHSENNSVVETCKSNENLAGLNKS